MNSTAKDSGNVARNPQHSESSKAGAHTPGRCICGREGERTGHTVACLAEGVGKARMIPSGAPTVRERFAPIKERSDAENWSGEKRALVNITRDALDEADALKAQNALLIEALDELARCMAWHGEQGHFVGMDAKALAIARAALASAKASGGAA